MLGREPLAIGDLILTEVLQGFTADRDFDRALALLRTLNPIEIGGHAMALAAARHYRSLRVLGVTVRRRSTR